MNSPDSLAFRLKQAVFEPSASAPRVAILLCTRHGERFLREQLESIERQTHGNWCVLASDDGSADDTHAILLDFQSRQRFGRVAIRSGPDRGFVINFLSLACDLLIEADHYAFCDQDDLWEPDKLERALAWLRSIPTDVPAVYCSRTRLIDAHGNEIGCSPLFRRQPSFANALVQSIAGGNTMVFNGAARNLLVRSGGVVNVASHDWWLYMIVTACGGQVKYDEYPSVRYRQHGHNMAGSNVGLRNKLQRARKLVKGTLRNWTNMHIRALANVRSYMTPANREVLDRFAIARESQLPHRLIQIRAAGVHRQTKIGNVGLVFASIINKI
jgi:glycosyltransferase involved in cell wall biosynthesis